MKTAVMMLTICAALGAAAAEYALDSCRAARNWIFIEGSEFKGAQGKISETGDGIMLEYDFTGGGAYVGMRPGNFTLPELAEYRFTVRSEHAVPVNFRLTDANGRTFQGREVTLRPNEDTELVLSIAGPWSGSWGGKPGVETFTAPAGGLWLTVGKPAAEPLAGKLLIKKFFGRSEQLPPGALQGGPFRESAFGWLLAGNWQPRMEGATLVLTATPGEGAAAAQFTITEPRPGRDAVTRYRLDPAEGARTIHWSPAFPAGVNPRNRSKIRFRLENSDGRGAQFTSELAGQLAGTVNLGAPRNSRDIPASRMGTCTHFSYAPKPEGPFTGWHPRERLLDEIAACGFKFIREGVSLDQLPDGSWKLRDIDLATIKAAKERGIEQIAVIDMSADESVPEFLKRVRAVVEGSRDYVNVYELGNEPNNFGNWRGKFPYQGKEGHWNGYEADGTVSQWVLEQLRYTNAAADLIKSLAPEKTVIGLGSAAPTNFHALNAGLSANVDGVVDHPYTYSLPPEKVPFGWNLTKRDGIQVGDAENSFAGLVYSYRDHFAKTGKMRSLWLTEFGFPGFWFDGKNETGLYAGFTEEAQAAYLVRRYLEGLALPIAVSCQYDFLDDYFSGEYDAESNFGLLRGDYSRKPAFYAVQRINSLLHGAQPDQSATVTITAAPLHRSAMRGDLIRDWDQQKITAANGVRAYAFADPATPDERMLALWSMQPYSREFNSRAVSFDIAGWEAFSEPPVAINLITGESYGLKLKQENGKLTVEQLPLKDQPLLIKFFKP